MPASTRKKRKSTAAEDDNVSVSSVGSRQSARLRRKRQLLEEDEEDEQLPRSEPRERKRRKNESNNKNNNNNSNHNMIHKMIIPEQNDDDDEEDEEMDRAELPAAVAIQFEDMAILEADQNRAAPESTNIIYPKEEPRTTKTTMPHWTTPVTLQNRLPLQQSSKTTTTTSPQPKNSEDDDDHLLRDGLVIPPTIRTGLQLGPAPTPFKMPVVTDGTSTNATTTTAPQPTTNLEYSPPRDHHNEMKNNVNHHQKLSHQRMADQTTIPETVHEDENGEHEESVGPPPPPQQQQEGENEKVRGLGWLHLAWQYIEQWIPRKEEPVEVRETMDGIVENDSLQHTKTSPGERTMNWFLGLLMFQVVFYPVSINPIFSFVVQASNIFLGFYQGSQSAKVWSSSLFATEDISRVFKQQEEKVRERLQQLQNLQQQLQQVSETAQATASAQKARQEQAKALQDSIFQLDTSLSTTAETWNQTVTHLKALALETLEEWNLATKSLEHVFGTSLLMPALSEQKLWHIPEIEAFEYEFDGDLDTGTPVLTNEDVEFALKELQNRLKNQVDILRNETEMEESIRNMVRGWIEEQYRERVSATAAKETEFAVHNKEEQLEMIRRLISQMLLVESADQTGMYDFAAIFNGASVLRYGKHATSLPIVETLPVVNRVAALLGLRFYGHGPEAALTPTHPPTALGQCFAFERQPFGKNYGTFTVRLAKKAFVYSIAIEHPTRGITDRRNTAIRGFQVLGFEDADAQGKAWDLGTFEFDMDDELVRQEFVVAEHDDDDEIPALRVISLVIASNWGGRYACLYRLRVHGEAEEQ